MPPRPGYYLIKSIFQNPVLGVSLVVQWLRLQMASAGGAGSILAQGTKIPHGAGPENLTKKTPNKTPTTTPTYPPSRPSTHTSSSRSPTCTPACVHIPPALVTSLICRVPCLNPWLGCSLAADRSHSYISFLPVFCCPSLTLRWKQWRGFPGTSS